MIKVNQRDFLSVLKLHKQLASCQRTVEAFCHTVLSASDGTLLVRTNNGDSELQSSLPCTGTLSAALDCKSLLKAVKDCQPLAKGKSNGNDIKIEVVGLTAEVTGTATILVYGMGVDDMPATMLYNAANPIFYSAVTLGDAVSYTAQAITPDEFRTTTWLGYLIFDEDAVVATDEQRLHRTSGLPHVGKNQTGINRTAALLLANICKRGETVTAYFNSGKSAFVCGDTTLVTSVMEASTSYSYKQVIPSLDLCEAGVKASCHSLLTALKAMTKASSRKSVVITANGTGHMEALGSDDIRVAAAGFDGKTLGNGEWKIGINPVYLTEAIDNLQALEIEVRSTGSELDPVRIDHGNHLAVIMPIRI